MATMDVDLVKMVVTITSHDGDVANAVPESKEKVEDVQPSVNINGDDGEAKEGEGGAGDED